MLRKTLAALFVPLFVAGTAAAKADDPPAYGGEADVNKGDVNGDVKGDVKKGDVKADAPNVNEAFSALHAVAQWSIKLSEMAEKRAKSDLVKDYARDVVKTNSESDAKLMNVAKEAGIEIAPPSAKTE